MIVVTPIARYTNHATKAIPAIVQTICIPFTFPFVLLAVQIERHYGDVKTDETQHGDKHYLQRQRWPYPSPLHLNHARRNIRDNDSDKRKDHDCRDNQVCSDVLPFVHFRSPFPHCHPQARQTWG
jgi:hypothetical protein